MVVFPGTVRRPVRPAVMPVVLPAQPFDAEVLVCLEIIVEKHKYRVHRTAQDAR